MFFSFALQNLWFLSTFAPTKMAVPNFHTKLLPNSQGSKVSCKKWTRHEQHETHFFPWSFPSCIGSGRQTLAGSCRWKISQNQLEKLCPVDQLSPVLQKLFSFCFDFDSSGCPSPKKRPISGRRKVTNIPIGSMGVVYLPT